MTKRLTPAINQGKQAAIQWPTRSFVRRIQLIEILNLLYLEPSIMQYSVLLCELADHHQNRMSYYSEKYMKQDNRLLKNAL